MNQEESEQNEVDKSSLEWTVEAAMDGTGSALFCKLQGLWNRIT